MEELLERIVEAVADRVVERLHMPAECRQYATVKEAAEYFRCCEAQIRKDISRMEKEGWPGVIRNGRHLVVDKLQMSRFLEVHIDN